tara:strand:+ start:1014 stop:1181 length:168 start_codon:yes stop_codon:yes gene_type:complete
VFLGIAEGQIEVAVLVQVEQMDPLQDTGAGDIEILAGIAECTPAECLESACPPYA